MIITIKIPGPTRQIKTQRKRQETVPPTTWIGDRLINNTFLPSRNEMLQNGLSPEPVRHFARLEESIFFVELAEGVEVEIE